MSLREPSAALSTFLVAAALAGCGGSSSKSAPAATKPLTQTAATTTQGAAALQAEAASAAAGDIPDNQVFLDFNNRAAGYRVKYPEGWAQRGSGGSVTFRDKNNIVRIVVAKGSAPTAATVRRELARLRGARVTTPPTTMTISGSSAIHAVYETRSAPNPVTGKTVTLGVDRYYLWKGGGVAIVDLGSPVAPVKVDNVDAYRLIIQSFRWR